MGVLTTQVVRDEAFEARRARMDALVAELRKRTALVAQGGGEKAVERHRSRGKLTARERIDRLVDSGTAFLEFSALAAWELYDGDAPSAGIVTGIGVVEGRQCVIVANDATVKGGSYYPLTVKKHLRAQEVARQSSETFEVVDGERLIAGVRDGRVDVLGHAELVGRVEREPRSQAVTRQIVDRDVSSVSGRIQHTDRRALAIR